MIADRIPVFAGLILVTLLAIATQLDAEPTRTTSAAPAELGEVRWLRDFPQAQRRAESEGKPLFVLFQEVPGCATCVNFGEQVLSHPLLIEAIEDEFIPVAVLNNKGGDDRQILERFGEPAWNNPVVRFVDAQGSDLIPRQDRIWRPGAVAARMSHALAAAGKQAPAYLTALGSELEPQGITRATLSMGCYWKGEACLGALPGLLSSRTGDLGGREVVEVRFDPTRLSYTELVRHARRTGCADGVFAHDDAQMKIAAEIFPDAVRRAPGRTQDASARNQKYQLKRNRKLAKLDLTPAQATRANALTWQKKDPTKILSPRQKAQLKRLN